MLRAILVLPLIGLAYAAQLFGYIGTCTQGDEDAFVMGALISAPLLLFSIWSMRRYGPRERDERLEARLALSVPGLAVLFAAASLSAENADLTRQIFFSGNTACGPDHPSVHAYPIQSVLIGVIYGVMPMILAATTLVGILRFLRADRFVSPSQ